MTATHSYITGQHTEPRAVVPYELDDATDLKIGRIRGVVHVVVMCRVCDSEGYDCSESCLVLLDCTEME